MEEGISNGSKDNKEEYSGDDEDYIDEDYYRVVKNWWPARLLQATELDYAVTVSVHSYYGHDNDLPKWRELYGSQGDQMNLWKQVLINYPLACDE